MSKQLRSLFTEPMDRFINYFPQLLVGLALLVCGLLLAWFIKRLLIHLVIILKLDHFLVRSRWRAAFQKADVRYGFYDFLGNIAAFIVFLAFLDFALIAWDLKILSDALEEVISIFPRFVASLIIFGAGWLLAQGAANALFRKLSSDMIPHAARISHYAQVMLVVFFAAMSLVELDIAREIVLIGFTVIFVVLGAIAVIITVLTAKRLVGAPEERSEPTSADDGEKERT
jgi:hypothetical protein